MSCSENGNKFARGAASAILPSSLERVCEVRKGRKTNFDILYAKLGPTEGTLTMLC